MVAKFVAWQQFLIGRKHVLAQYDAGLAHAKDRPVATHHGNVAEAAVRDWLTTFLPKRFGVTAGYIRRQGFADALLSAHFDVIIYDQLEAPLLWVEKNADKADAGRARIIPAENVCAILEVKAAFDRRSVGKATMKLSELTPFLVAVDSPDAHYPKYLPPSTVCAMVFIELRCKDRGDRRALAGIRDVQLPRGFYGGVILRGENMHADVTGSIQKTISDEPMAEMWPEAGLLSQMTMTDSLELAGRHHGAMLSWADVHFSQFAFDLLALLKGTYRQGYSSSLHGYDFHRKA